MKSLRLESVTFYQSVHLNRVGYNTVHKSLKGLSTVQCAFLDDKIFIRDKNWTKEGSKNTVIIVGLHNVRSFVINVDDFKSSSYTDVFECFKVEEESATVYPNHIAGTLPEKEDVQAELDAMEIPYDKRWGVQKLIEVKDAQGVQQL